MTADPSARRPLDRRAYVAALLEERSEVPGPGPVGHGFSPDHVRDGATWWSRPVGPHVQLVAIDTTNHTTGSEGRLSSVQYRWLEAELTRHSSRWFDERGREQRAARPDRLVVVAGHHSSWTMTNPMADEAFPGPHHDGAALVALLVRFPNVVLLVNGHTHAHRIVGHRSPYVAGAGCWEVNTASCIDFGQQTRTIELVDNGDGTLSVATTVVDHLAPVRTGWPARGDASATVLASMARELAANDGRWIDPFALRGSVEDRNAELVVRAPFPIGT